MQGPGRNTTMRVVKEVALAVVDIMRDRIGWPKTELECRKMALAFSKKSFPYRMPNVIG